MRQRILAFACLLLLCSFHIAAQTYQPFNNPHQQFLDTNGKPLANGKIYTYAAGTTTKAATYKDSGGTPYRFSVDNFRQFLDTIKQSSSGVVPAKFNVTEATNAPWYERPEVNREALDQQVHTFGTPIETGQPQRGAGLSEPAQGAVSYGTRPGAGGKGVGDIAPLRKARRAPLNP